MRSILGLLVSMFLTLNIFASSGGFNNDIADSRTWGNDFSVTARSLNPSTNWYNPAGLTKLEGSQISGTIMSENIYTELDSTTAGNIDAEDGNFIVPSLFYSQNLGNKFAFGFGIHSPYGLITEWDNSVTDYVATKSELTTINFNPNIAYQFSDDLSVAAGINYYAAEGNLKKKLNLTLLNSYLYGITTGQQALLVSPDGESTLEGTDNAMGWNLALQYNLSDRIAFGLSYKSKVDFTLEDKVSMEGLNGITAQVFGGASYETDAEVDISLPSTINFGIAYKIDEALTIEADLEYTEWSVIDQFDVKYTSETNPVRLSILNSGNPQNKDWDNTLNYSVGGEYKLNDSTILTAGTRYRPSPIPEETFDPSIPSCDLFDVAGGVCYMFGQSQIDFALGYIWGLSRDVDNTVGNSVGASIDGEYAQSGIVLGVSYVYKI